MDEQRRQKRQTRTADAYLELTLADEEGDFIQKVIACETVDLSASGLKLYMSEPVEQGLITDILVELTGEVERYFLTAELKWIAPGGDDGWYFAGFEIFAGDNTDYQAWADRVARKPAPHRQDGD